MRDLNQLLGIQSNLSMAYHPQTDSQTECVNQEVEQYLHLFVNYHQSDWSEWLPLVEFSYNKSSTGYSPFYLNYGQHPHTAYNPHVCTRNDSAETFAAHMQHIRDDANSALVKSAATMKRFYDRSHSMSPNYQPGDSVWLEAMNLKLFAPVRNSTTDALARLRSFSMLVSEPFTWHYLLRSPSVALVLH